MSAIRIRVGASLDANALTVFIPLQRAAATARAAIEKDLNKIPKALAAGPYRTAARGAGVEIEKIGGAAKKTADVVGSATQDSAKKFKALSDSAKKLTPTLQAVAKEAQRELDKINKASARAALGLSGGGGGGGSKFGSRVGYWSMRNFAPVTPTLSIAKNIAGSLARGAGIQTDMSSYVSSFISRQKMATDIANTGYIPGASGANGQRQNGADLVGEANAIGKSTATDPQAVLQGLQDFVKLTGDLETGRAVLSDMAKLSRATGTDMTKMVNAAGAVSKNLGDVGTAFGTAKEKAAAVDEVMRGMAAQGKIGSVDISDLAKTMSKVAGAAGQIGGTTGADKVHNIMMMGALTQEARGVGGAASPEEAANAAMGFVNTMKRPARAKAFAAAGVNVFDKAGKIRGPEEIILESLSRTHGDTIKMGGLFANIAGAKAVTGFSNTYKDTFAATNGTAAQKDAAGLKAVHAEIGKLMVTMSKDDEQAAFDKSMEDAAAKAQIFQNQLQEIADKMMTSLIPAMERLAPRAEQIASAFASFISWATENPGDAIGAALTASIAKAGLEQVLRGGIEKAFSGSVGGGIGQSLTIAAMSIAAVTIGEAYITSFYAQKQKEQQSDALSLGAAEADIGAVTGKESITQAAADKIKSDKAASDAAIARKKAEIASGPGAMDLIMAGAAGLVHPISGGKMVAEAKNETDAQNARLLDMLVKENQRLNATMDKIANGGIKVAPATTAAPADQSGRQPANSPAPR